MAALPFDPPANGSPIKVAALNVAFYKSPSRSAEKALKVTNQTNTYVNWAIGDSVKFLGNVIQNTEGTWLEAETLRWFRRNLFSGWYPILLTVYYRVEDQTATWVGNSVVGGKPSAPVGGSGTTPNPNTTPAPEKEQDNTLQKVGIGIGLLSILIALRK